MRKTALIFVVLFGFAVSSDAQIQTDTTNGWYVTKVTSGVTKFYTRLVTSPSTYVYSGKSSQLFGMVTRQGDSARVTKKFEAEYDIPVRVKLVFGYNLFKPSDEFSTLNFHVFFSHGDTVEQLFGVTSGGVLEQGWHGWSEINFSYPSSHFLIRKFDAVTIKFYVTGSAINSAEMILDNLRLIYEDGSETMLDNFDGGVAEKASFKMPTAPWDFGNVRQDSVVSTRLGAKNDIAIVPGALDALIYKIESRIKHVSVSPDTAIVPPGQTRNFTITCAPDKQTPIGDFFGYIVFYLQNCTTAAESVAVMGVVDKTTGIEETFGNTPNVYSLGQNYPNPFNPATRIKFDIPKDSHVSLIVYNMLGQIVATLVNWQLQAGTYEYEFNETRSLASGVYLYRIQAENFKETRKMVLVK